ncbi:MAG TPA: lytic murein transglycosylase B [Casimicrobiaceae bacterium]|nr:lytic murein transglycosylase B [Casimicrobiaceae bacterium]
MPRLLVVSSLVVALSLGVAVPTLAAEPAAKRRAETTTRVNYTDREDVRAFIAEMNATHGFPLDDLNRWLSAARFQPRIVELMNKPVMEPPKWFEYAPPFLAPARIDAGVEFWKTHAVALARAQADTGVPPEVIVAIIGVETSFGKYTGSHRVIDALATLAFDYPRRATFFRGELKEFLLLAREQGFSPVAPKGSFAGAMGLPQFMPGSYRRYAIDFDRTGRVDLFDSAEDAIGSVANYLARHDWQRGQPVLIPARIDPQQMSTVMRRLDGGLSERRLASMWAADGVTPVAWPGVIGPEPLGVLLLEESKEDVSYWIACHNFYVITRYNRSRLYATAVWQLAQAIKAARSPS